MAVNLATVKLEQAKKPILSGGGLGPSSGRLVDARANRKQILLGHESR